MLNVEKITQSAKTFCGILMDSNTYQCVPENELKQKVNQGAMIISIDQRKTRVDNLITIKSHRKYLYNSEKKMM